MGKYDDIIGLAHHRSARHRPMSPTERAGQFAAFAALSGYEAAVKESARMTDGRRIPDEDRKNLLDARARLLTQKGAGAEICVTFFLPDGKKEGGAYRELRGRFGRIDVTERRLFFADGTSVPLDDILSMDGAVFDEISE